jgi:hypothetical protein
MAATAHALEVREARWGFDGKIVPERFNLLSVRLANPGTATFDGVVTLQKLRGFEGAGAPYAAACYLAPHGERWVQFTPYVGGDDRWRLAWGRGLGQRHELDPPNPGPPARVWLTDEQALRPVRSALPLFPAQLFPPTVAAADGLDSVVLDHVPRWEAARREAFLDWLRRGGTVHVTLDERGQPPEFPADLAVLNAPTDRVRVGNGLVVRHAQPARQLAEPSLVAAGFAAPVLERNRDQVVVYDPAERLLQALGGLSRPAIRWGWIFTFSVGYLIVIGPLQFWYARRSRNYRRAVGLLLGTVVGFTLLFAVLGRRGAAETTVTHSLAYARALGGRDWLVTQWSNLFVARGAAYVVGHDAPHNLYAALPDYEPIAGLVQCGKPGALTVDLPLFAQRGFVHQAKLTGDDLGLTWESPAPLRQVQVGIGTDFPAQPLGMWAVRGGDIWTLRRDGRQLVDARRESLDKFCERQNLDPNNQLLPWKHDAAATPEHTFSNAAPLLVAQALGDRKELPWRLTTGVDPRRLQVFVLAPLPAGFRHPRPAEGRQLGAVLYHVVVRPPSS